MTRAPFRLLVFDWDGTLLDSVATIVACVQATLHELGQQPADESVVRSSIGLGVRDTVAAFRPGCDDELFGRIVAVYGRLWSERFATEPRLFSGVEAVLRSLKGGDGYLLAVATAKSRRGLDQDLDRTGLLGFFDSTRTVGEARGKPHPEMLLSLMQELGVAADETLMIGDTVHDLEMAARAGVASVAVLSGCENAKTLSRLAPLTCLRSAVDLPAWLASRHRAGGVG